MVGLIGILVGLPLIGYVVVGVLPDGLVGQIVLFVGMSAPG